MLPIRLATLATILVLTACSEQPKVPAAAPVQEAAPAAEEAPVLAPVPMAYEEPVVGGARMAAGNDMLSNLRKSSDHTILVSALESTGLDKVIQDSGAVTVFAPTNSAFERFPGGYQDLIKPGQRERLLRVLSYHVLPTRLDADAMSARVLAGNGSAMLETVEGGSLKATVGNGAAMVVDANGNSARITVPNVQHSNGVVYVIETVLTP
ncbi:MAG: fasciclin domain-containing protein [Pseudomonadota bacterium]|nr:fasciclin domain-containing protein [Pseudomonadota bacterium]